MKRRDVIKHISVGGATLIVLPLAFHSCTKEDNNGSNGNGTGNNSVKIDLTAASSAALANSGGFIIVSNIIVINTGGGNYIALSSVCTHEGCQITYNASAENLPCGCHGSIFSRNGSVLNGPAVASLAAYTVTKSGNMLIINR